MVLQIWPARSHLRTNNLTKHKICENAVFLFFVQLVGEHPPPHGKHVVNCEDTQANTRMWLWEMPDFN
jgi:hypothetical protein